MDPEVAADLQHGQQVEQAIIIPARTAGNGGLPQFRHKLFANLMRCRKRGDGVHGHQAGAVIVSQLPARQCVEIAIPAHTLCVKKAEQAIGLQNCPIVTGKSEIIDCDIHGNAPGVPRQGEIIANTNRALGIFKAALSYLRGFAATIPLVWREIAVPTSPSHAVTKILPFVCQARSL